MKLLCILMLLIMPASALSVGISMSDGASVYTETTTTHLEMSDSFRSQTRMSLAGNQLNSYTVLDKEGNGSIEVTRTLRSTERVSVESSVSETGGKLHAEFGMMLNGHDLQWMDNATIRNADKARFSIRTDRLNAFVELTNGSMNANSMVMVKPGWNAWGLHSPADIKSKVAFNVSL
jgi:uncharacterized surface anchored protein